MAFQFRSLFLAALAAVLALAAVATVGCGHTFEVEGRQTRMNIWLTAPTLCERGESIDAVIYVGPYKVVDGPVSFPKGINVVILPPVYVRQGNHKVTAVLGGGKFSAEQTIGVQREGWLDITLRDRVLNIVHSETEPSRIGR
jgi:hypothetical protein